jgi:hypothetical protein
VPSQDKRTDKTRKAVIQTAGYRETADPAEVGGDGSMCIKEDPYIICDGCGGKIHKETDEYEQDDCYEIDGYRLCADCVMRYLRREHRVRLNG